MSQFLKYIEKPYRGGDRLDSIINVAIGKEENDLNELKKEHFQRMEKMKSEFRNQNRNSLKENETKENETEIIECECSETKNNNTKILIVFIILFIIVFGLILLLKFTNSSNIIELINNLKNNV